MANRIVLHIEGGQPNPQKLHERFRNKEWQEIRLDPTPEFAPDLIGSLIDMKNVPDNFADAIFCTDKLAFYPRQHTASILSECIRSLKPEGELIMRTPDSSVAARHICNGWSSTPMKGQKPDVEPKLYADDMIYGPPRPDGSPSYRQLLTIHNLSSYLHIAGFGNLQLSRKDRWIWLSACANPASIDDASGPTRVFDHHPLNSPYRESQGSDMLSTEPVQWKPLNLGLKSA